jgi:hypothetical protein
MPIHDWSCVDAGVFHHFHKMWPVELTGVLNRRVLASPYYSLIQPCDARVESDEAPCNEELHYVYRRDRIAVKSANDLRDVARIEVISQRNKSVADATTAIADSIATAVMDGTHVLMIDFSVPGTESADSLRDHVARALGRPQSKLAGSGALTVTFYLGYQSAAPVTQTYDIGQQLNACGLCLSGDDQVLLPLEDTYKSAFLSVPRIFRDVIEGYART